MNKCINHAYKMDVSRFSNIIKYQCSRCNNVTTEYINNTNRHILNGLFDIT
jgi:hypothetical protein